jgi:hypothetical protein
MCCGRQWGAIITNCESVRILFRNGEENPSNMVYSQSFEQMSSLMAGAPVENFDNFDNNEEEHANSWRESCADGYIP